MSYHLILSDDALDDIERLKKGGEVKVLKKLNSFYPELREHPRTGI